MVDTIARLLNLDPVSLQWPVEATGRLLLASFCAGLVGVEREVRGRQAGFRTNVLVGLGSALIMLMSLSMAKYRWGDLLGEGVSISYDPTRISYAVMTGIGFLGAGAIVQRRTEVRGLTTAAALWCVAAIGLSAGFGLYYITLMATVLVLLTLWILDYVESIMPKNHYRVVVVRREWAAGSVPETIKYFESRGVMVIEVSFERELDNNSIEITLNVVVPKKALYYQFERELEAHGSLTLIGARNHA